MKDRRIIVLGVGNVLMKDEGIGVHVAREMQKRSLAEGVEVIDGGTAGLELLNLVDGATRLIIVDCIDAGCEPGAVFKFAPSQMGNVAKNGRLSLHDVGIWEVLTVGRALEKLPEEITIVGIQPKEIGFGEELSPTLRARLPLIVSHIEHILERR